MQTNLVSEERHTVAVNINDNDTNYLDAIFSVEENDIQVSNSDVLQTDSFSNTSSNSCVVSQDNTQYINSSQPLQINSQEDSHGYEVTVTVHQGIDSSSGSEDDVTLNTYSHVYQPLQKGWDIEINRYEKPQSTENYTVNGSQLHQPTITPFRTCILRSTTNSNLDSAVVDKDETMVKHDDSLQDKLDQIHPNKYNRTAANDIKESIAVSLIECLNSEKYDMSSLRGCTDSK